MKTLRHAAALAALAFAGHAGAYTAYGFIQPNTILKFDTSTPGTVSASTLTGIPLDESILGVDIRPSNGKFYLLTRTSQGVGRLYRLVLGQPAALVAVLTADPTDATAPYTSLPSGEYGVDVNPVPDRIRAVSNGGTNLRINPDTGTVITDSTINPGDPDVTAVGYTNSDVDAATGTTLYAIDVLDNRLAIVNPPNNGSLVTVGVGLGVDPTTANLDILLVNGANAAFATMAVGGTMFLFAVDLATGAVITIGSIGGNPTFAGFTVSDEVFSNGFE